MRKVVKYFCDFCNQEFDSELDYISTQLVDSLGTEHSRNTGGYYGY